MKISELQEHLASAIERVGDIEVEIIIHTGHKIACKDAPVPIRMTGVGYGDKGFTIYGNANLKPKRYNAKT